MYLLGRSALPLSTCFKNVMKVIDWTLFLTLTTIALISAEGSYEAYRNGKTSWDIEQRPITRHPTFILSLQGVRVTFQLFEKAITSSKIDLEQKFLLVSANHGRPFHLR